MDLIGPWADQGELPTFQMLLGDGASGVLRSTIPSYTIPAWPSMFTGVNPGKHSLYDFLRPRLGSYEVTAETKPSLTIRKPAVWSLLSKARRRVGVITVPGTFPPLPVRGYLVSGMFTPPGESFAYPPNFENELLELTGGFDFFFHVTSGRKVRQLLEDMTLLFNQRARTVEHMLSRDLDFIMMVDNGTDKGAHEFWRFLDAESPLRDDQEVEMYGNPLLSYYQHIDRWLGDLVDRLDEDDLLLLVSDHGSGPVHHLINLNQILIEEGFMHVGTGMNHRSRYSLYKLGLHPAFLYGILRRIGVEQEIAHRVGKERMLGILRRFFFSLKDIDWRRSAVYASGVTGSLRLNLKGREPEGIIRPGEEEESLSIDLAESLNGWKNPISGSTAIDDVRRREDLYQGPEIGSAPDLVALPGDRHEFFGMHGFVFSDVVAPAYERSGSHRRDGIFLAYQSGETLDARGLSPSIFDIAPSILRLLEVPPPADFDGLPISAIMP